jgi:hypothetical protein
MLSVADIILRRMLELLVNKILERIWKQTVMDQFEVISWYFVGGTEENDELLIVAAERQIDDILT